MKFIHAVSTLGIKGNNVYSTFYRHFKRTENQIVLQRGLETSVEHNQCQMVLPGEDIKQMGFPSMHRHQQTHPP